MLLSMRLFEIAHDLPSSQSAVARELELLARMANSIEQELEVHRLHERQRMAQRTLERNATEALAELITDPAGKIVRPRFGRDG
jgi:transcriptional regulator GlxA family with amidase domain